MARSATRPPVLLRVLERLLAMLPTRPRVLPLALSASDRDRAAPQLNPLLVLPAPPPVPSAALLPMPPMLRAVPPKELAMLWADFSARSEIRLLALQANSARLSMVSSLVLVAPLAVSARLLVMASPAPVKPLGILSAKLEMRPRAPWAMLPMQPLVLSVMLLVPRRMPPRPSDRTLPPPPTVPWVPPALPLVTPLVPPLVPLLMLPTLPQARPADLVMLLVVFLVALARP